MIDRKKFLLRSLVPILACSLFGGIGFAATQNSTATQSATDQTAPMTAAQKRAAKKAAKKEAKQQAQTQTQTQKAAGNNSAPATSMGSNKMEKKPSSTMTGVASPSEIANAKAKGMVWVNTQSKVYHSGGKYYGNTKQGQFMTEADAQKAGYKAAKR